MGGIKTTEYAKSPSPTRRIFGLLMAFLLVASLLPLIVITTSESVRASPDPNFGNETIGGVTANIQNKIRGFGATCPAAGTAQSISVYFIDFYSGSKTKTAIYRKSDSFLIGETEELTGDGGTGWYVFPFSDPKPSLDATDYVLCMWGNQTMYGNVVYDPVTVYRYYKSMTYGNWPDPFDGTMGEAAYKYSIYCTYSTEAAPPTKPVLVSPENNYSTSDNTPTFIWENGANATSHRLVIDNDSTFSDEENIYDNASAWNNTGTIIENELPPDNYWWKVCATNAEGDNWSENTWTFEITPIVNVAPNTPTNLQPTGIQTTTSVTISCVGIDNDGDDMNVHFYDNSDNSPIDNIWIENGQTAQVTWSTLVRGNTYTFFAGAQDNNDQWGENSDTQTFTVNTIPIAENQKAEGLTTFTPTLSWDYFDAEGDTQENFHVQVGTSENDNDLCDSNQQNSDSHTTYAGSVLDEDVTYHWRVRVYDGYEWSGWLYGGTFTISIPPHEIPDPILLVVFTLVLMVLAMAFDSPILTAFGGISSIFVGLLLLDTLWVGSIFLGLGMYFMLTAVLSEWGD